MQVDSASSAAVVTVTITRLSLPIVFKIFALRYYRNINRKAYFACQSINDKDKHFFQQ